MSKIKKENKDTLADFKTDWEIYLWGKALYDKHESEFKVWIGEYRALRKVYNDDARMARWRWIEKHGGLVMRLDNFGKLYPSVFAERYAEIFAQFDRMDDWLSFQEKKTMTPETRLGKIRGIFADAPKISMAISEEIKKTAEPIGDCINPF